MVEMLQVLMAGVRPRVQPTGLQVPTDKATEVRAPGANLPIEPSPGAILEITIQGAAIPGATIREAHHREAIRQVEA